MNESVKDHRTLKWRSGVVRHEHDYLAVEEPLEIRIGRQATVTMRTPGHDKELAAGFLLAEGFINSRRELSEIRRLRDSRGHPEPNRIEVILSVPSAELAERLRRNFAISSSCGLCGKTSIEAIERRITPLISTTHIAAGALFQMPVLMREAQAVFSTTGGLHAAALFEYPAAVRTTIPPPDQGTLGGAKRIRSAEALSLPKGKESPTCAPDEEISWGLTDSEAFQNPNLRADKA
jgi:formate dehydrogenase assembly factor FdhD